MEPIETEEVELTPIDYIVWDLETTGFDAPDKKILEIGCFIVRNGEIERKHWVLDNKCEIPEEIVKITGIDQSIIDAEGRDPKECLMEFLPLFEQSKMNISHNGIRFDIPFFVNTMAHQFDYSEKEKQDLQNFIRSRAFDTAVFFKAKKLRMQRNPEVPYINFADQVMNIRAYGVKYNLGLCVQELGIKHDLTQHRAMADVELTHEVFKIISKPTENNEQRRISETVGESA